MSDVVVRADAFTLPFRDGAFEVVVADPPYDGKNRGKKGVGYKQAGYVPFAGRAWWHEAWRVLRPSGHLYVMCAVREVRPWLREIDEVEIDVIGWIAPNNPSVSAFWRRNIGGRAPAWRPIIHWQREPHVPIEWSGVPNDGRVNPISGRPLFGGPGLYVDPNVYVTPAIQSNMHEAAPWPNQLPVKLLRWLLRPHHGRVLDLFSGTGTAREAAIGLGLDVVSVDLSPEAIVLTRRRQAQMPLASEVTGGGQ